MSVTYKTNSVYAFTPMNSNFLGIWEPPELEITGNEATIIIPRHQQYRPDLLSYQLYGTSKLWWSFKMINPDKLNDPIWDFVTGLEILASNKKDLSAYMS